MADAICIDRDMRGKRRQRDSDAGDAAIVALAERQHGVVTRRQLAALGLGADAIDRRLRAKRLLPLYRAVYAVGHRQATKRTAWMAAVLAGGNAAVLSHRAAAAHWGLRAWSGSAIDVTTPRSQRPKPNISFHRTILPADEITVHEGIPITTVPRTIFDLAANTDQRQVERAINEAEINRLWDELSLHDLLHRYPGRAGTGNVRAALRRRNEGASHTKSDLEEFFLAFAERWRLPRPETNVYVEGIEVDCVWREQRVVIEVDSWEFHRTRAAFERDREKSRILQAAGWRCVAVTHRQLEEAAEDLARDVRRLLATATLAA
jgi:very-short-patch-repair endonuclease/predicted transcriptional regulator of viral defense system